MKHRLVFALVVCAPFLHAASFVNGQAARAMLGQYSFTYAGGAASNQILGSVGGLAYANGTLYAADSNFIQASTSTSQHNRVLAFPTGFIQDARADLTVQTNPAGDIFCGLCGYPATNVLGQVDFSSTNPGLAQSAANNQSGSLNVPSAVATDGSVFAVADTNNNRVLIWNTVPTTLNAPANIVLGQANFTSRPVSSLVTASSLRGPQGVWIQNGKLFVADTGNYRVLIWNSIPTANNQPANVVLGQPNFTTVNQPPVTVANPTSSATTLSNPVSATSDGTHLFVSDLGFNRVLIWNTIPTTNTQPADVVIGQPDMTNTAPNNSGPLCGAQPTTDPLDPTKQVFPPCANTLNFPRFALSDGTKLFLADGGNDRVLIYNTIPTANGAAADTVLGQPDFSTNLVSNQSSSTSIISTTIDNTGSVDTVPSPLSLAYDGTNLYVADGNNSRVLVYTPGDTLLGQKSVLNTASKITRQTGFVTIALAGSIAAGDTVAITVGSNTYTYTLKSTDTLATITTGLINLINAGSGDANVIALTGTIADTVFVVSRSTTAAYDSIALSSTASNTVNETVTTSGAYLAGGNAGTGAPGTIIEVDNPGGGLSDSTLSANSQKALPHTLGGVQVYLDGLAAPLFYVSPTQIIAQVPFEYSDRNSSSVYVRTLHTDGSVTVSTPAPLLITDANPGLFGGSATSDVRPAYGALHQAGNPSATISIDGTPTSGDIITLTVNGRNYAYTVTSTDTLITVVTALVNAINAGSGDAQVTAAPGGAFTRVVLTARQPGAAGNGIPVSGTAAAATSSGTASETVSAYQTSTCCSTTGTGLVTAGNPAQPNETITFLATGLGAVVFSDLSAVPLPTGQPYTGAQPTSAADSVAATVNAATGEVVSAGVASGGIGVYEVNIIMPSSLTANAQTPVYIAQNAFISNTVTIPVGTSGSSATPISTTLPPLPWETGSIAVNNGIPASSGNQNQSKLLVYPVIWQPSTSIWTRQPGNGVQDRQSLGQPGDIPAPGDYDGDGTVDLAVYRPSNATFYVIPSSSPSVVYTQQWGQAGDVPVPADYDGSGRSNYALFRPSTGQWLLISSLNPSVTLTATWGQPGDIPVPGDYDGNRIADLAVFRPSTGQWLLRSNVNPNLTLTLIWGQAGDIPVAGDYDGDGVTDLAVFRPSTGNWIIRSSANPGVSLALPWGQIGDIPVPGDYDGDGIFDAAVYRPSTGTWIIRPSSNPSAVMNVQLGDRLSIPANAPYNAALKWKVPNYPVNWQANGGTWTIPSLGNPLLQSAGLIGQTLGQPGDIPVPGDWDGDGILDFAVWRPSNGTWYVVPSSNPTQIITQVWGQNGDIPAPGNYDGSGKLNFAFWRPSTGQYYLMSSINPALTLVLPWGQAGDIPVPGDYDGDGLTDLAVYRPSTGTWILRSSANPLLSLSLPWGGQPGDIPVPGDYDGDGLTDLAIYRPSTGDWLLRSSRNPSLSLTVNWGGQPGDIPVPGDYDGDGEADPAFWRPSSQSWNIRPSSNPSQPIVNVSGAAGSLPANAPNTIAIYNEAHQ